MNVFRPVKLLGTEKSETITQNTCDSNFLPLKLMRAFEIKRKSIKFVP